MKYNLLEDHQVRLSDTVLKAGIYTWQELQEAHKHDSLEFCIKHTKLGKKLSIVIEDEKEIISKTKKKK